MSKMKYKQDEELVRKFGDWDENKKIICEGQKTPVWTERKFRSKIWGQIWKRLYSLTHAEGLGEDTYGG